VLLAVGTPAAVTAVLDAADGAAPGLDGAAPGLDGVGRGSQQGGLAVIGLQ
jgi:hypothetical protein